MTAFLPRNQKIKNICRRWPDAGITDRLKCCVVCGDRKVAFVWSAVRQIPAVDFFVPRRSVAGTAPVPVQGSSSRLRRVQDGSRGPTAVRGRTTGRARRFVPVDGPAGAGGGNSSDGHHLRYAGRYRVDSQADPVTGI